MDVHPGSGLMIERGWGERRERSGANTYHILQRRANPMQIPNDRLQEDGFRLLPLPNNHPRSQNNGMLKPHVPNRILHPDLHPAVRHIPAHQPSRSRARHKHIRLHPGRLGRSSILNAQIVVDLPLFLQTARKSAGGPHGIEDDGRRGGEGGEHAAPSGGVGFLDGFEFGGLGGGEAAGDGFDGGERVCGEEGVEDLASDGAGGAENCGCGHGGREGEWEERGDGGTSLGELSRGDVIWMIWMIM